MEYILFSPIVEAFNGPGELMALRLPMDEYKKIFKAYPGESDEIIFFIAAPVGVEFSKGERVDIFIRKNTTG